MCSQGSLSTWLASSVHNVDRRQLLLPSFVCCLISTNYAPLPEFLILQRPRRPRIHRVCLKRSPPRVLSGIKTRLKPPPTPPSNHKRNRICHNEVCDVLRIPTSS
ncbi:hypothetical protein B0T18DRAFT_107593 [Schizothecium vesticola]|uniref:Uncharacterized protein n=1 Tax=Schizothecium vesticola TaxID=314040 RepID=A0AA40K840_9PEZI|nr:hypothetical protein B0T18DRAFT_107593 [Schizothecium vesticola]